MRVQRYGVRIALSTYSTRPRGSVVHTLSLHLAGRRVHLCLGDAPRVARRYRGRDVVAWLEDIGYYRTTADQRNTDDGEAARANHYVTGRDGGRDIDLRAFARDGMQLYGLLEDFVAGELRFRQDLRVGLDHADKVSEGIKDSIDKHIAENGLAAPEEARYVPVWEPAQESTRLAPDGSGITSVLWAIGFRADYRWIELPVFDERGLPVHTRGATSEPGLLFLGLPWQWTWGSARFSGVGADAEHLVGLLARSAGVTPSGGPPQSPAARRLRRGHASHAPAEDDHVHPSASCSRAWPCVVPRRPCATSPSVRPVTAGEANTGGHGVPRRSIQPVVMPTAAAPCRSHGCTATIAHRSSATPRESAA